MNSDRHPIQHPAALERLKQGNARFAANVRSIEALSSQKQREALAAGQQPFAVILSCSDSRAPSECVDRGGHRAAARVAHRHHELGPEGGGGELDARHDGRSHDVPGDAHDEKLVWAEYSLETGAVDFFDV